MFQYRLVMLAHFAFQACSIDHSDISQALESMTYERSEIKLSHTPLVIPSGAAIVFAISKLKRTDDTARKELCKNP